MMKYLCQRNEKWSDVHLGASKLTVGKMGCTTTSISMLSDYFGCYQPPSQIASDVHNYTKDGLIIWNNLKFDKMFFTWREHGRNDKNIRKALKGKDTAVILEVSNGKHWVVALRKANYGNDYLILDPWTGTKEWAIKKYGNITGAAYFNRIMVEQDVIDEEFGKELGKREYPFFLQVDNKGELWYVHKDGTREYLHPDNILDFMKEHATGISNIDLNKIKIK